MADHPAHNPIHRVISKVRLRGMLQNWLTAQGWMLSAGISAALLLLVTERTLALPVPFWAYGVILFTVLLVPPTCAWITRLDWQSAAELIDQQLNLKDRLGSALYAEQLDSDPLAEHVVDDARRTAASINTRDALPIRLHHVWLVTPPTGIMVILTVLFLPQMDLAGLERARLEHTAEQDLTQRTGQEVVEAVDAVQPLITAEDQAPEDPNNPGAHQALDRLAQLSEQNLASPGERSEALGDLTDASQRLGEKAETQSKRINTLKNTLSRLDPLEPGPADSLADALRRGDFEDAAAAAQELARDVESMSPSERDSLARQLQNMAKQLEQEATHHQNAASDARRQQTEALREAGLESDERDNDQPPPATEQGLQKAMEERGIDPEKAQRLAREAKRHDEQRRTNEQVQRQCEDLSSSMNEMCEGTKDGQASRQNQSSTGTAPPTTKTEAGNSSGERVADAGQDLKRQLDGIAEKDQQTDQLREARARLDRAIDELSSGQPQDSKAGTSDGGPLLGQRRRMDSYNVGTHHDANPDAQTDGPIIARWLIDEPPAKGEPTTEVSRAVTKARNDAERAITEDRVPKRYHDSIRKYFDQLPAQANQPTSASNEEDSPEAPPPTPEDEQP